MIVPRPDRLIITSRELWLLVRRYAEIQGHEVDDDARLEIVMNSEHEAEIEEGGLVQ